MCLKGKTKRFCISSALGSAVVTVVEESSYTCLLQRCIHLWRKKETWDTLVETVDYNVSEATANQYPG